MFVCEEERAGWADGGERGGEGQVSVMLSRPWNNGLFWCALSCFFVFVFLCENVFCHQIATRID